MLAPCIAWLIWHHAYASALGWLTFAVLTDAGDGFLARRFHWESRLGVTLDPIADKALLVLGFLGLGAAGLVPVWFVALVLARDVLILLFGAWALSRRLVRDLPPSIWGKISTIFQSAFAVAVLCDAAGVIETTGFGPYLQGAAVAATVASGLDYARTGLRLLRGRV